MRTSFPAIVVAATLSAAISGCATTDKPDPMAVQAQIDDSRGPTQRIAEDEVLPVLWLLGKVALHGS